jgi:enoyl-CoA hydratase/carnithine racemase
MTRDRVIVERTGNGVATVVIAQEERRNALDQAGFDALADAFEALGRDADAQVVVLTGAGDAFCAGADISGAGGLADRAAARRWMERTHRGPLALHLLPQPTIAAVHGPAAGAGLGLALLCDVRLASPQASFSAPFARMGLVPDFGVSATLPRIAGDAFAADALLSGRRIAADEARAAGLVSRVVEDVRAEAHELAVAVAALPGGAAAAMKRHLRACRPHTVEEVLRRSEPEAQSAAISDPEFAARAAAWFAAKGAAR